MTEKNLTNWLCFCY